jgi:hypothetical protein
MEALRQLPNFDYNPILGMKKLGKFWVAGLAYSKKLYHPIPRRDSISRPIAPVSSVAGGEDTTRPRRQDKVLLT